MLGGLNQMKKLIGVLVFGLLLAVFTATPTFAQEPDRATLYETYEKNYQAKTVEGKQKALNAAKDYIAKFNTPDDKPQVDYFKEAIPALEKAIEDIKKAEAEKIAREKEQALLNRFDTSVKGKNWADTFGSGKEILSKKPDFLDVYIVLSTIGFDRAEEKVDTYNEDAVNYAKKAIQMIEAGTASETGNYGAFGTYQFKTTEFPDGKNNALGWLNYQIGYIMYNRQNKKKDALPYLYKATQYNSATKAFPQPYELIGAYYYDEVARIDKERRDKIAANNNEDNEETNALYALEKGYAERGADAYARAYKMESAKKQPVASYQNFLKGRLEQLYKFRFDDKTDGMDSWVATVSSKPFPNPTSTVEPVKEELPTTDSTTTDSAMTSTTPSTKPAATTTTKTSATTNSTNTKTPSDKKPRNR